MSKRKGAEATSGDDEPSVEVQMELRCSDGDQEPGAGVQQERSYVNGEYMLVQRYKLPKKAYDIGQYVQERLTPFACGGFAPAALDAFQVYFKDKDELQMLKFPVLQLPKLKDIDGGGTARILGPQEIVTDLNLSELGILTKVQQILLPVPGDTLLKAKLNEARVYGPGDATRKALGDGGDGVLAYLVLTLPGDFTSGEAVVTKGDETFEQRDSSSKFSWISFKPDVSSYEVKPVSTGFKVELEYKLYATSTDEVASVQSFPGKLYEMLKQALDDEKFFPDGADLAFPCQHVYSFNNEFEVENEYGELEEKPVKEYKDVVPLLKGSDAEVYHALEKAGLSVLLCSVLNARFYDFEVRGLKMLSKTFWDDYGEAFSSVVENDYGCYEPVWCHDRGHWKEGFGAYVQYDHKRGDIEYHKKMMTIIANIPSWPEREEEKKRRLE